MTSYHSYGVSLSDGQKEKLGKAYRNNSAVTIRLSKNELSGPDELMLTKTQLKRIQKAMRNNTGCDIKISKSQIRKAVKQGGSLWSSLVSLGTKLLPMVTKKVLPSLATGAMSGLASLGVDKIFGNGQVGGQTGGFIIPQTKIDRLIKYKDWLTEAQKKKQIVNAIHTGGQVVIKPTKTQSGGFLGTLLASIGVPLLLNALTGSGLQIDGSRSRRSTPVYVPKRNNTSSSKRTDGGLVLPVNPNLKPPPFFGSWEKPVRMGIIKKSQQQQKKTNKKGQRTSTRQKQPFQQHTASRSDILRPHFINKALSNFDLLDWVKKLGIKHFRGIYSRDNLPKQIKIDECGIINLYSQIGPGTHWVAYRNGNKYTEYFDSFGLIMSSEIIKYLGTSGKQIVSVFWRRNTRERQCPLWLLVSLLPSRTTEG